MTKKGLINLFMVIIFELMLFYFVVGKVSGFSVYFKNNFDKYISVQIKHPDGTVNYYDSNKFPSVNKGDIVYATVNLPKDRYINNSVMCFYSYYSIVSVFDNNGKLYYADEDKQTQEDEMLGGICVFAYIPKDAWGQSFVIKLDVQKDKAFSKIQDVMVMSSVESYKYLIGTKEAEVLLYISILVISMIVLFVLIFVGKWDTIRRQGAYLLGVLGLISLWLLGYNDILSLLSNNTVLMDNIKYIALFSSPVMLSLFFYEQDKRKMSKRMHLAFALMYGIYSLMCICLNYTTMNYDYFKMIPTFRFLLVLGIIAELFIIIKHNDTDDISIEAIRYGGILFLIISMLELMKDYFYKYFNFCTVQATQKFSSIEMMILIVSLILSYTAQLAEHYISEYEKRNLEKLAYHDALTGIPNRAGCYKYFDNLECSEENALVFIDVNKLKYANDVFGHEMGDALIRYIAEALERAFKNHGFYGRFGGDEFVAIISSGRIDKIYDCMYTFKEILFKANEKNVFPFEVSVSYGISVSTKSNPLCVEELIKKADQKMYKYKRRHKMGRL